MLSENVGSGIAFLRKLSIDLRRAARWGKHCRAETSHLHPQYLQIAKSTVFDSDHHQNRRLSSHSYSHESVIFFVFFGLIFFKLRRVYVFSVEMYAATLRLNTSTAGAGQSIILR